jgi:Ras-related protein Rab-7A
MASLGPRLLKVIPLGDTDVGKTSILNQFVNREFSLQYKATIGSDFTCRQLEIDGRMITLQIWDTAGQERFQSLGWRFFRGSDCCILVYDVTRPSSFQSIQKWQTNFLAQMEVTNPSDFAFLLLGNKADIPSKAVQTSAGREYAEMNGGMLFYEASAKTGDNVQSAFEEVVRRRLEKVPNDKFEIPVGVTSLEKGVEFQREQKGQCPC